MYKHAQGSDVHTTRLDVDFDHASGIAPVSLGFTKVPPKPWDVAGPDRTRRSSDSCVYLVCVQAQDVCMTLSNTHNIPLAQRTETLAYAMELIADPRLARDSAV